MKCQILFSGKNKKNIILETICMNCQILFSKKNINVLSAEFAQSDVS